jgi:hypothetical protein
MLRSITAPLGFSSSFVAVFHCNYHKDILWILNPLSDEATLLTSSSDHRITHSLELQRTMIVGTRTVTHVSTQGCTNCGWKVAPATKFCAMAPNICGSSVWNFLHVNFLVTRTSRWPLDFWKICSRLFQLTYFPEGREIAVPYVPPSVSSH